MSLNPDSPWPQKDQRALTVIFRASFQAVLHPFEYGKTLIQLGYEPLHPWPVKSFFGKQHMMLPNIFQYVNYMSTKEGSNWSLYRGVKLRFCETIVNQFAYHMATDYLFPESSVEPKSDEEEEDVSDEDRRSRYFDEMLKDVAGRSIAVIVSHPLHVCVIRSMAQFVGGEVKYFGFWSSMSELYKENGICGFFSGLVPRLLAEVLQLVMWHSLTYAVTTYIYQDKENKALVSTVMGFIASSVTYPLHVVSKCMCVSGSGLVAGQPPLMPLYPSWIACFSQLHSRDQLWRGSSILFWRYDTRPRIQQVPSLTAPNKFFAS